MKEVTLKEFLEIAKDNDELKHSVADCVKVSRGGQLPDELLDLAAGAGYKINKLDIAGLALPNGGQILHDEQLSAVSAGGGLFDKASLCEKIIRFLGGDLEYCAEE